MKYVIYFRYILEKNKWYIMSAYSIDNKNKINYLFNDVPYTVKKDDVRFLSFNKHPFKYMVANIDNASLHEHFRYNNNKAVKCRNILHNNEYFSNLLGYKNYWF